MVRDLVEQQDGRVLDDAPENFTLELSGTGTHLDEFIDRISAHASIMAVVRSGSLAIARGQQALRATI